jgi:hypothetical protein
MLSDALTLCARPGTWQSPSQRITQSNGHLRSPPPDPKPVTDIQINPVQALGPQRMLGIIPSMNPGAHSGRFICSPSGPVAKWVCSRSRTAPFWIASWAWMAARGTLTGAR